MWEISNLRQTAAFLYSILLGGMLCVAYDALRGIRTVFSSDFWAVLFEDLIYFTACAVAVFCFLLATTNGEIRFFVLVGIVLGFAALRITASNFILKAFLFIFGILKTFFTALNNLIYAFLIRICRLLTQICSVLCKKLKKAVKLCKKVLKKQ